MSSDGLLALLHHEVPTKIADPTSSADSPADPVFGLIAHVLNRLEASRHISLVTHEWRVGRLSARLARSLGLAEELCQRIGLAATVHDIGKLVLPDALILAEGPLSAEQWCLLRQHAEFGYRILSRLDGPMARLAAAIARHHHERFDGSGYPHGLGGSDIPFEARIVAVCDVYDALRSRRPYKSALSHHDALRILLEGDGRTAPEHFDPAVLAAFANLSGHDGAV